MEQAGSVFPDSVEASMTEMRLRSKMAASCMGYSFARDSQKALRHLHSLDVVVCCDERGLATFQLLRHRRTEPQAFLYAFDLLELNGADLRREPIEVRKATLASI